MIYLLPALIVFLIELCLLISWLKHPQKAEKKALMLCFWGFLVGQIYLLWEVFLIKQTGQPLPGSADQKMLMFRLALGGALGGLFTIIGLFYASFAYFDRLKAPEQKNKHE